MNPAAVRRVQLLSEYGARSFTRCLAQRTFTSSALRLKQVVPTFKPTSSPELDAHLEYLRTNSFLISQLSKAQKDLVLKPKNKKLLAAEPVIVTINEEEFQLVPLDLQKDIPNAWEGVRKAMAMMMGNDNHGWENLPNLLQGVKNVRKGRSVPLGDTMILQILQLATRSGRQDIILECLRRVGDTGMELRSARIANFVMYSLFQKAFSAEWEAGETEKALKWAEMVYEMLEDPHHTGKQVFDETTNPRNSTIVIGMLLEISAMRATQKQGGKDEDGKVALYANRLLSTPATFDPLPPSNENGPWLCNQIPVLHGMRRAQEILGPQSALTKGLKEKSSELEGLITPVLDEVSGLQASKPEKEFASIALYNKLLGSS